jgi:hypothetical protein
MLDGKRYSFTEASNSLGFSNATPYLPVKLSYRNFSINATGLLDVGASVNVLAYEIGLQLGAVW